MNEPDLPSPRAPWRTLLAPLLIIGLCLVAWWGCLSADFYMDDFLFLVKDDRSGPIERAWLVLGVPVVANEAPGAITIEIFQLIPTLMSVISEKLAAAPGFQPEYYHAWNLLLHTAAAVMAFVCGRSLLALALPAWDPVLRQRAAVLGALIFAMHPLCTEPVNYAKCTNSLTVLLFSLAALHGLFRLLAGGGPAARRWLVAGSVLTIFSYFPGSVLLAGWVLAVSVWHWRRPGSRPWKAEAAAAAAWVRASRLRMGATTVVTVAVLAYWMLVVHRQVTVYGSSLAAHWLTQGRIFWDYLALLVWPAELCSDRLVPWSTSWRDTEAVLKLAGCLVLGGGMAWGLLRARSERARLAALLATLCLMPLGIRFLYMNFEVMVEYRTYPCLPWLGLGAGCLIARLWERSRLVGPAAAVGLVAACMARSMERTAVWGSQGLLAEDVLAQYPLNPRAMLQLQLERFTLGQHGRVRELHESMIAAFGEALKGQLGGVPGRAYSPETWTDRIADSCYLMVFVTAAEKGETAAAEWAAEMKERLARAAPQSFAGDAGAKRHSTMDQAMAKVRANFSEMRRVTEARKPALPDAAAAAVAP